MMEIDVYLKKYFMVLNYVKVIGFIFLNIYCYD